VELAARAVKDMLADTNARGTLPHVVRNRMAAALGFYAAFQDGVVPTAFPELRRSLDAFMGTGDWGALEGAVETIRSKAADCARVMMGIHREGRLRNDPHWTAAAFQDRVLTPMGIAAPASTPRGGVHDRTR
jgi:hypothetical protein